MAGTDGQRPARYFLRGLGIALGIFALSLLLLLLAPAGTVLLVTFAPLAAGYYGARAGSRRPDRGWLLLGVSAGSIWSLVETGIFLTLLAGILGTVDPLEPYGLGALAACAASNILFCALGARLGAAGAHAA